MKSTGGQTLDVGENKGEQFWEEKKCFTMEMKKEEINACKS